MAAPQEQPEKKKKHQNWICTLVRVQEINAHTKPDKTPRVPAKTSHSFCTSSSADEFSEPTTPLPH